MLTVSSVPGRFKRININKLHVSQTYSERFQSETLKPNTSDFDDRWSTSLPNPAARYLAINVAMSDRFVKQYRSAKKKAPWQRQIDVVPIWRRLSGSWRSSTQDRSSTSYLILIKASVNTSDDRKTETLDLSIVIRICAIFFTWVSGRWIENCDNGDHRASVCMQPHVVPVVGATTPFFHASVFVSRANTGLQARKPRSLFKSIAISPCRCISGRNM